MNRFPTMRIFFGLFILAGMFLIQGCHKKVSSTDPETLTPTGLSIRSVSPSEGRTDAPTPAKVLGSGFEATATVFLGDQPLEGIQVVSSTELRAVVSPGLKAGTYDLLVRNPDGKEANLRAAFTVKDATAANQGSGGANCNVENVYFAFDVFTLSDKARDTLKRNADCIRARGGARITVEGHADERGSTEYNLALGQERANSVKNYLSNLGVGQISTISYGEERPAVQGHDEASWSKNRRAETIIVESGLVRN